MYPVKQYSTAFAIAYIHNLFVIHSPCILTSEVCVEVVVALDVGISKADL